MHKRIEITIPPILLDKKVKTIRMISKANARFFEIQYIYLDECIKRNRKPSDALDLDLGINNLVIAVSSKGNTFIINERKLKFINQWYNKQNAKLQSMKEKQHFGITIKFLFTTRIIQRNIYLVVKEDVVECISVLIENV